MPKYTQEEYEALFPPDFRSCLDSVIRKYDTEQKPLREYHLKEYKKLDFYWNSLQNIFWQETAKDWRPYQDGISANPQMDVDEDDIGRIINVYRAFGESIIAGLSADVPSVAFAPDNADSIDDISTAKAYGKISELIGKHNNASQLLVQALFIKFNQAFVAAYNYNDRDEKYGTVKVPSQQPIEMSVMQATCPYCGSEIPIDPADESSSPVLCPTCGQFVQPEYVPQTVTTLIPTFESCPKSREIVEFYGPMNVKIPFYASTQENCPYLMLTGEYHVSVAKEMFPWIAETLVPTRSYSDFEKWARQPSEAYMNPDSEIVSIRRVWLRPEAYWSIENEHERNEILAKYPNGMYSAWVDDTFAEAADENLDDHWTITKDPLSVYLHAPPIGRVLVDIQDMTNDMYNLVLRSIQYGVPLTFVDANALDMDKFKELPSEPGMVVPIKVQAGLNASGSFHTISTSSISQEVDRFNTKLEQAGQFVSGAYPSVYGGTMEGGGKTFKEYDASRSQALQRLGTTWKMLNTWWKDWMTKAVKEYARNLMYDEYYTEKSGDSYVTVWIKRSELQGKIGDVEAETSAQFPMSLVQQRGLLIDLFNMNNPIIAQALVDSQNLGDMTRLLGFDKIHVPGDDQRNKQLREINELKMSAPIPQMQPQMNPDGSPMVDVNRQPVMQPIEVSSIPPESIDNHQVHWETTQAFLVSDQGQQLKVENPPAYQNILLHGEEHQQELQKQQMQQLQMQTLVQKSKVDAYPPNKVNYNVTEVQK